MEPEFELPCSQSQPPVPILTTYIQSTHCHAIKISINVILQSSPWSSNWSLPFTFSSWYSACISRLYYAPYTSRLLHSTDLSILIICGTEYKLWISTMHNFLRPPVTSPVRSKYSPRHHVLWHTQCVHWPTCMHVCTYIYCRGFTRQDGVTGRPPPPHHSKRLPPFSDIRMPLAPPRGLQADPQTVPNRAICSSHSRNTGKKRGAEQSWAGVKRERRSGIAKCADCETWDTS